MAVADALVSRIEVCTPFSLPRSTSKYGSNSVAAGTVSLVPMAARAGAAASRQSANNAERAKHVERSVFRREVMCRLALCVDWILVMLGSISQGASVERRVLRTERNRRGHIYREATHSRARDGHCAYTAGVGRAGGAGQGRRRRCREGNGGAVHRNVARIVQRHRRHVLRDTVGQLAVGGDRERG